MLPRCLLLLHDTFAIIALALVLSVGLPGAAFAYVDPSVMTYTIQALAGAAVALSAVLGVTFRRSRRALMRLFHIDENAKKQVEPPVHPIHASQPDAGALLAEADQAARLVKQGANSEGAAEQLSWKRRFVQALIVSLFLVVTLFVVPPLEVVGQSTFGLLFNFYDILPLVLITGALVVILMALALSALRGRGFTVALAVAAGIGIAAYIQALFLNKDLPIADGSLLNLPDHMEMVTASSLTWVIILFALLFFGLKRERIFRVFALVVSIALVVVQGASVVSIATDQRVLDGLQMEKVVATREGLYTLSPQQNIVVFVLDTYDQRFLDEALQDDPALLDELTGFTCYTNSTAQMIPTRYAMPFLTTGRAPQPGDDFKEFVQSWFDGDILIKDIHDQGYTLGIYSDSLGTDITKVAPFAMNVHEITPPPYDPFRMIAELERVALYRDLPWVLKPTFWFTTDDLNQAYSEQGDVASMPFTVDDLRLAKGLREKGITLNREDKSFRLIHMLGPHRPFLMDERGMPASGEPTRSQQARGNIKIVSEYLQQMKQLGIYDDAFIVITADHGHWQNEPTGLTEPTSVILMVKPPETPEEARQPLCFSTVPTGHLDLPATIAQAAGADASRYGMTVFDVTEGPRERHYWHTTTDYHEDTEWTQFAVNGDVLDHDAWSRTGEAIPIPPPDRG